MKTKLLILFLCYWSATFGQSVPNNTTFSFFDVATAVYGDHNSGRNLVSAFSDATSAKFDPAYSGSKNSLLNFRNYGATTVPTVTTTAITAIITTTATGGGNVTSDGNATVTARGICWSNSSNPTLANPYTSDGSGTGSFASSITGLAANTLYHVRAYATNSVGTSYGSDVSFTTATALHIGDFYQGGYICYLLVSGDPGYSSTVQHGIIGASSDQGTAVWGCSGTTISGTNTGIRTGQANTTAILGGCATSGIAAKLCDDLVLNGYSDWYLPSAEEAVTLRQSFMSLGYGKRYWSSSQYSSTDGACIETDYGGYGPAAKTNTYYIRAVRSF